VECDTRIPRFRRPIAVEDDQAGDESSYRVPLVTSWGIVLLDSEKPEALADDLQTPFQPANDPSFPAVIERLTWG
jgi:hypothetical protein